MIQIVLSACLSYLSDMSLDFFGFVIAHRVVKSAKANPRMREEWNEVSISGMGYTQIS